MILTLVNSGDKGQIFSRQRIDAPQQIHAQKFLSRFRRNILILLGKFGHSLKIKLNI
jgi:hypothetical protein